MQLTHSTPELHAVATSELWLAREARVLSDVSQGPGMPRLKISHARRARKRICKRRSQPASIDVPTLACRCDMRFAAPCELCVCVVVSSCMCSYVADNDKHAAAGPQCYVT